MAVKARAEITLSSIRDVQSVTRYYLLQSSTSAVPSKPTTNPPGGNWVTAEPTYTSGSTNSLYFVDLTVFSDGTFAYSGVSLSSSYEAAKVAYNKADNAESVANSASDKVDNIEVGGRNLLPGTKTFSQWYTNYPASITFHDGIADIEEIPNKVWRYIGSPSIKLSDVAGKDLTVSMDIRSDDYEEIATEIYPCGSLYLKVKGPEACHYNYRSKGSEAFILSRAATSEWKRFSFVYHNVTEETFTVNYSDQSGDAPWLSVGLWFYIAQSFQIRNIKLEIGNVATDWTPAPEDIEASISAANALAQSAKNTADGKITTFYAASTATPTATTVGDLWIKTDDGNSLWRWNGSAWVSVDNADIQSALTAAGTAQATADSKVITFAQASTPTATDIGDIWIDTDDSNRMYRWNGTAWVDVHDPKIAEANEKIDNLQIGGRNLLLNSEHFIPDSGIFSGSNANLYTNATFDGEGLYYASGSKYVKVTFPNLTIGEQYAFSCEVARQSGGASAPVYITINGEEAVEVGTATELVWTKFNVIFTATSSTTYAKVQVYTAVSSGNAGWVAHFRHFKLERGNRATDWTPAPEDVIEAGISAANEAVDGLQIGGRNLIINTLYPNVSLAVNRPKLLGQIGTTTGRGTVSAAEHGLRFTNTAVNWQYIYFGLSSNNAAVDMLGLEPGETYTLSADLSWKLYSAEGQIATTYYIGAFLAYSTVESGSFTMLNMPNQIPIAQADKGTEMSGRLVYTFTVPTTAKRLYLGIRGDITTTKYYAVGDYIEARNLKLEKGTKVTDWTPAPEDLENAITTSQETADGKNTVYYQNSAPTNQTFKVNDIWFDTDDENKMYHWNGSAWTAAPFGNAAFSNIDAGKVTTGTMSAARIKGDILTLGGANNVDGMLKVYDANGTLVGSFTREGLMAIAGTIGGWTIGATQLYNTYLEDNAIQHSAAFSPTDELQFSVSDNGTGTTMLDVHDRTAIYGSNGINFAVRTLDDEWYQSYVAPRGDDYGVRIGPALDVYGPLSSSSMKSSSLELQTNMGSYIRQPAMIMSGVATISTGTSEKNLTLCTVPTEYQSGYRIVPFVSRRYGSASGTPSDAGDFYYAYYNSVTHNVHIKLANKLPSGVIFQFDYMIYAVPES